MLPSSKHSQTHTKQRHLPHLSPILDHISITTPTRSHAQLAQHLVKPHPLAPQPMNFRVEIDVDGKPDHAPARLHLEGDEPHGHALSGPHDPDLAAESRRERVVCAPHGRQVTPARRQTVIVEELRKVLDHGALDRFDSCGRSRFLYRGPEIIRGLFHPFG
ncbi:hypothetical protein PG993_013227 [Apiospora rasikravindrae]|uniref:Uncharacterized protein n=1 Tax=Apiospora rasikravindrae TaxID=990691 RepID=A0ABR1RYG0_9PEZI